MASNQFGFLTIREPTANDMREIWLWWNDETSRKMMKENEPVAWGIHVDWFRNILSDLDRTLYLFEDRGSKIGVVRFDRKSENIFETSINLDPDHRGKGYGAKMIAHGVCKTFSDKNAETCFATVKKINLASWKSFVKAGHAICENELLMIKNFDPQFEYYLTIERPRS